MGFGDGSGGKKKMTVIGLSSILLVALVVAVAVGVTKHDQTGNSGKSEGSGSNGGGVATTNKAVTAICQPTDYKATCAESLSKAENTTDPKELVKIAFEVTIDNINDAIANSSLLEEAAKDPRTRSAFEVCKKLLNTSIDDLRRSFEKVDGFEVSDLSSYVADLKTWLSGAITYQETCLDGFQNTTGDSGEKMKKLLEMSRELSSNGLAMITDLSEIVSVMQIPGLSRRLLSDESRVSTLGLPSWISHAQRRLLQAEVSAVKADAVVAQDGKGKFKTINEALKAVPANKTFVILIKAGVYNENVIVPRTAEGVVFIGEGAHKTIINGSKSYLDGIAAYETATVGIDGARFMAKDIGFVNSAGADAHSAVALRSSSDMSIFYRCSMDGFQNTLFAHAYRQFYRDCKISGTIDIIFGDASSVFQNCSMIVKAPLDEQICSVTAQGRVDKRSTGAIIIQGGHISADPAFYKIVPPAESYLGRPWKEYSRTIVMQTDIDRNISPEGWAPWSGTFGEATCFFGEFGNKGPGANQAKRVRWKGIKKITAEEAETFTAGKFIGGDDWVKTAGIPYDSGMMKV